MHFGPLPFVCITFADVICLYSDIPMGSPIYEPFYVVNTIFDTFMKVEFNSFKLNSLLLIFDLANQSGDQVSLNLI